VRVVCSGNPLATFTATAEERIPLSIDVENYNEKHVGYEARTYNTRSKGRILVSSKLRVLLKKLVNIGVE
jgi:hypothetical protein